MNESGPKVNNSENKEKRRFSGLEISYGISAKAVEDVLTSRGFERTLKLTIAEVIKYNREFGFLIGKEKAKDKFHYSIPVGGEDDDSVEINYAAKEMTDALEEQGVAETDWFEWGNLHFHGYEVPRRKLNILVPSDADINSSLESQQVYKIPLIHIIANLISKRETEALLYRVPATYSLLEKPAMYEELIRTLKDLFYKNASQQEVIRVLVSYGFEAGIIYFLNGKPTKESIDLIRSLRTDLTRV